MVIEIVILSHLYNVNSNGFSFFFFFIFFFLESPSRSIYNSGVFPSCHHLPSASVNNSADTEVTAREVEEQTRFRWEISWLRQGRVLLKNHKPFYSICSSQQTTLNAKRAEEARKISPPIEGQNDLTVILQLGERKGSQFFLMHTPPPRSFLLILIWPDADLPQKLQ